MEMCHYWSLQLFVRKKASFKIRMRTMTGFRHTLVMTLFCFLFVIFVGFILDLSNSPSQGSTSKRSQLTCRVHRLREREKEKTAFGFWITPRFYPRLFLTLWLSTKIDQNWFLFQLIFLWKPLLSLCECIFFVIEYLFDLNMSHNTQERDKKAL